MLDGLELFSIGVSWGGFESLVRPTSVAGNRTATHWEPPGPLLRFHIGLEDPRDLIADLDAGFARLNRSVPVQTPVQTPAQAPAQAPAQVPGQTAGQTATESGIS